MDYLGGLKAIARAFRMEEGGRTGLGVRDLKTLHSWLRHYTADFEDGRRNYELINQEVSRS